MAGLKNDKEKDKPVAETTNSTETNVNTETVTQNQVTAEVKTEKNEAKKEDKTYIYVGEELTKDSFILKHKGFYTIYCQ